MVTLTEHNQPLVQAMGSGQNQVDWASQSLLLLTTDTLYACNTQSSGMLCRERR
jgi:hypothetical protein